MKTVLVAILAGLTLTVSSFAQPSPTLVTDHDKTLKIPPIEAKYIMKRFIDKSGDEVTGVIVPSKPPGSHREPIASVEANAVTLSTIPAYDWSFGCSATAAAMIAGYYDNRGYASIYTGPTNGGVAPMNNSSWGTVTINGEVRSQCPISATRLGVDGRTTRGSVDDYWKKYNDCTSDPYITYGWSQHSPDCTADFLKTSQSAYTNCDGSTRYYFYTNGSLYSGTLSDDGCYGLKLFFQSRGYTATSYYTQAIYGYSGNTTGFTFGQFQQEINLGYPVMIQLQGHSMVGYGYDAATATIYVHDTWDYSNHSMTWGGSYAGMQQWGVGVYHLPPIASPAPFVLLSPGNGASGQGTSGTLSWQASSGAGQYDVYLGTANPPAIIAANQSATTFSYSGLANNTTYFWKVIAKNAGGSTTASGSPWSFTTVAVTAVPPTPILVSPANGSTGQSTSLTLAWNPSSGASSYRLQVATTSSFAHIVDDIMVLFGTSYPIVGLVANTSYYWRVSAKNAAGISAWSPTWTFKTQRVQKNRQASPGVVSDVEEVPAAFELGSNFPNPFNPTTVIPYELPVESHITIRVYNVMGQEVATLVDGVQGSGLRQAEWSGTNVPSGVYYYRIEATSVEGRDLLFTEVKRMLLVK